MLCMGRVVSDRASGAVNNKTYSARVSKNSHVNCDECQAVLTKPADFLVLFIGVHDIKRLALS